MFGGITKLCGHQRFTLDMSDFRDRMAPLPPARPSAALAPLAWPEEAARRDDVVVVLHARSVVVRCVCEFKCVLIEMLDLVAFCEIWGAECVCVCARASM